MDSDIHTDRQTDRRREVSVGSYILQRVADDALLTAEVSNATLVVYLSVSEWMSCESGADQAIIISWQSRLSPPSLPLSLSTLSVSRGAAGWRSTFLTIIVLGLVAWLPVFSPLSTLYRQTGKTYRNLSAETELRLAVWGNIERERDAEHCTVVNYRYVRSTVQSVPLNSSLAIMCQRTSPLKIASRSTVHLCIVLTCAVYTIDVKMFK